MADDDLVEALRKAAIAAADRAAGAPNEALARAAHDLTIAWAIAQDPSRIEVLAFSTRARDPR